MPGCQVAYKSQGRCCAVMSKQPVASFLKSLPAKGRVCVLQSASMQFQLLASALSLWVSALAMRSFSTGRGAFGPPLHLPPSAPRAFMSRFLDCLRQVSSAPNISMGSSRVVPPPPPLLGAPHQAPLWFRGCCLGDVATPCTRLFPHQGSSHQDLLTVPAGE